MANGGLTYPTTASNVIVVEHLLDKFRKDVSGLPGTSRLHGDEKRPFYRWSNRFQWLPCEVDFTGEESSSTDVRITSYINNLRPRNQRAYAAIEKHKSLSLNLVESSSKQTTNQSLSAAHQDLWIHHKWHER